MDKKNIIFICTDQHRTDTLSCYQPNTLCRTPALDQLAAESVVFDNAYTSCPVCTPARSSMQTGLYPSKTGMETNCHETGGRTQELVDSPYLLSRRLQSVGYNCGFTGKWHLGEGKDKTKTQDGRNILKRISNGDFAMAPYANQGSLPTELGFIGDDFPGHGGGGWWYPQYKQYLEDNHLELDIADKTVDDLRPGDHIITGEIKSPESTAVEYFLVERAKAIIDDLLSRGKPFYFTLNFWGPHSPFYAPTKYLDMYRNVSIPQNPTFDEDTSNAPKIYEILRRPEKPWSFFENSLRHYYACTTFIDAQIGRLMDYLKEKGIYDDTMVIFAADHGDNQGCHGGLENKSFSMYDDTTKVPLIVKPAVANYQGYHQKAFVGTCDFYATILKQAGFEPDDAYGYGQGRPLNGFITDPDQPWSDEIVTEGMGAFPVVTTQRMYRKGKYKYVFNGAGEDQLFDMEADPLELRNLALEPESQELLCSVRYSFADWMDRNGDFICNAFCKINHIRLWTRD